MCIAIYKPAGQVITKDILSVCNDNNPDGMGFAFPDSGRVEIVKTPYYADFDEWYKEYSSRAKDVPMLIHFRIATHGQMDDANTHPFQVNPSLAFIHNGIIPGLGDKHYSDTWYFNKQLAEVSTKTIHYRIIQDMMADYIGRGSKLVFLDSKGRHVIINQQAGHWVNGVWYSNNSYEEYVPAPSLTGWAGRYGNQPATKTKQQYSEDPSYKIYDDDDGVELQFAEEGCNCLGCGTPLYLDEADTGVCEDCVHWMTPEIIQQLQEQAQYDSIIELTPDMEVSDDPNRDCVLCGPGALDPSYQCGDKCKAVAYG